MSFASSRVLRQATKERRWRRCSTATPPPCGAKDVDAFVDLYADDVRTFDLWSVWSYDGKDGVPRDGQRSGSARSRTTRSWRSSSTRSARRPAPTSAAVSAFTTFAAVSPDGTELRSMNNRLTWVLRKDADGAWKIAHEHTSAPAGDEGKVQLRR